jgi:hypothetical protein
MRRQLLQSAVLSFSLLLVAACTSYKSQEVPFRPPSAMPNMQIVAGAQVAAQAYVDKTEAKQAFGFDIRDAGLLPVQVIVDNGGKHGLLVVPEQTFLIDAQGNMWNLLDRRTAYERMEKSSEYARVAKKAGRGSVFGATGGALLGAAIGILTGDNVGEAALRGGPRWRRWAVIGGGQELGSDESARRSPVTWPTRNWRTRRFSPDRWGEVPLLPRRSSFGEGLKAAIEEEGSGQVHTLTLPLQ